MSLILLIFFIPLRALLRPEWSRVPSVDSLLKHININLSLGTTFDHIFLITALWWLHKRSFMGGINLPRSVRHATLYLRHRELWLSLFDNFHLGMMSYSFLLDLLFDLYLFLFIWLNRFSFIDKNQFFLHIWVIIWSFLFFLMRLSLSFGSRTWHQERIVLKIRLVFSNQLLHGFFSFEIFFNFYDQTFLSGCLKTQAHVNLKHIIDVCIFIIVINLFFYDFCFAKTRKSWLKR